jgi:Flp pilus assembly protein TadB
MLPEAVLRLAAGLAGVCVGIMVLALAAVPRPLAAWLPRSRLTGLEKPDPVQPTVFTGVTGLLGRWLERAGWSETPERLLAATAGAALAPGLAVGACGFIAGFPAAALLAALAMLAVPTVTAFLLLSSANRRRHALAAQLPPLLDLVSLELSAGGSALSALGTVTARAGGSLAADLRRLLVSAQVSGSTSFEARLSDYAELHRLTSLLTLAVLLRTGREYGAGVGDGIRALAADLSRARRRELIADSRRALNRVLVPAAVGVLLPFVAILLYPAVSTLMSAFG